MSRATGPVAVVGGDGPATELRDAIVGRMRSSGRTVVEGHHDDAADSVVVAPWTPIALDRLPGAVADLRRAADRAAAGAGRVVLVVPSASRSGHGSQESAAVADGLASVARVLARHLGPRGATVNTVAAGCPEVDAHETAGALVPVTVDDVAAVVAFLVADDATFCTGTTWPVDGGATMGFG